jgi:hypothetical protein
MRSVVFDDLAPACHGGRRDFFLDLLRHNRLCSLFAASNSGSASSRSQRLVSQPFDGPRASLREKGGKNVCFC